MIYTPDGAIDKVTTIGICAILTGSLLPIGLTIMSGADTSTWDIQVISMWGITTMIFVVAIVLAVVGYARTG